jgi:predicted polyphosphate/ATP-dependent NAD kinase
MGGRVGLKGTDGEDVQRQCRLLGAMPEAPARTIEALRQLLPIKDDIEIITYPFEMGEEEAKACAFEPTIIGSVKKGRTTGQDSRKAAVDLQRTGVDLILFAGGDGTARDIYSGIGDRAVVLGIPAGVKIHSAVYATNPRAAGELAAMYLIRKLTSVREAEVMDIDEEAFRQGRISAKLHGYLRIPFEQAFVQSMKAGQKDSEEEDLENIAFAILDGMEPDCLYVLGPGTTTRAIKSKMSSVNTLLGVDVALNRQLVARDLGENQLLALIEGKRVKIIVTVIGGQGYIFGRGNQQISSRVIQRVGKENIIVVATKDKLSALAGKPLLVDTGDNETNKMLSGYIRVVTGYSKRAVFRVAS